MLFPATLTPASTFVTATLAPDITATFTPSITDTPPVIAPTDSPTDTPTGTPTDTPTIPPSPTSPVNAYVGTWVNIEENPSAQGLSFPLTRVLIGNNGDGTFSYKACGKTASGERYIDSKNIIAKFEDNTLTLYPFHLNSQIFWSIKLSLVSSTDLSATVNEQTNLLLRGYATYEMVKINTNLRAIAACGEPVFTQ
jgi:hypothetical protein